MAAHANEQRLQNELQTSAARFAQSALRGLLEDDAAIFLLHAGTALEQLTKSYLASLNDSLVAANDFDSLLHACGLGDRADRPRLRMKTITFTESLKRAAQLVPALRNLTGELALLVDVRNGVAHLAHVEPGAASKVLVPFLKASDQLVGAMSADRSLLWGDLLKMVDTRLSDSAQEAEVRVAEAIAAAQLAFEKRFAGLDEDVRRAMLELIRDTYNPDKYEQDYVDCPACEELALVSGTNTVDWEPDWDYSDGEVWAAGAYPVVRLYPAHLGCGACGLELDGEDELRAAGITQWWELQNVNPADFHEPEWDDYGE